ncbi:hypothetical protein cgR_6045 [Corynebacterium glutamicum R]|uniref:DUF2867 domain-containing protein n=1 Tax=Corynebacterium glutamicum (strain R) TaxID=340322 RepID=A0AB72VFU0_CORGB|nr:hypothetical protein cgR_6045 [Corynebacterium glutamicum R]
MSLLRTRGGISKTGTTDVERAISSPHTRRYFLDPPAYEALVALFSAHAEVFPLPRGTLEAHHPLLRTRGGISSHVLSNGFPARSSPHTRRYFRKSPPEFRWRSLFSAHAEVFPAITVEELATTSLLRTRGGISGMFLHRRRVILSSPHTRRYFLVARPRLVCHLLFSAHAEVFPPNRCRQGNA